MRRWHADDGNDIVASGMSRQFRRKSLDRTHSGSPNNQRRSITTSWTMAAWWPLCVSLALVAMTIAVYAPVGHFGFLKWDDQSYVTENPHVLGGLSWRSVVWAFTNGYRPYWHPLTWLSHLLDVRLFGVQAAGHHFMSVAIHIACTILLFE